MWIKQITITLLTISLFVIIGGCYQNNHVVDINPLVKYAQQFTPCTKDGDCRNLYKTPDDIRYILEKHEMTYEYKASVMLVLLKQYNYEYANFHQGYEIRKGMFHKESAFVEAYMRISGDHGVDYMTARVAYDWVNKHPEFLKNEQITIEMNRIKDTEKKIEESINN